MELTKAHSAIETSLNAIFSSDLEGNVSYANFAAAKMWGFGDPKNMIGSHVLDYWTEESQEKAREIICILKKNGSYSGEGLVGKRKDGSEFTIEIQSAVLKDRSGNPIGMVASFSDITNHKKAEEALKETMRDIERFNRLAVGRELQMIELKREVNDLLYSMGRQEKYRIP